MSPVKLIFSQYLPGTKYLQGADETQWDGERKGRLEPLLPSQIWLSALCQWLSSAAAHFLLGLCFGLSAISIVTAKEWRDWLHLAPTDMEWVHAALQIDFQIGREKRYHECVCVGLDN